MKHKFTFSLFALMFIMGAIFIHPFISVALANAAPDGFTVSATWIDSENLRIEVTDTQTGASSTTEVNLQDYTADNEYISIQAVDEDGKKSNIIQVKNPYYNADTQEQTESSVPNRPGAFTPDGAGTVTDNVTTGVDPETGESKEFYTISTPDENVFYLIVDRQRDKDNVYFLNAVTEDDLMSLAKSSKATSNSAIPSQDTEAQESPPPSASSPPAETPSTKSGGSNNTLIFLLLAVLAAGGAGYYFKIYKPKQQASDPDDDYDFDDNSDLEEPDEDVGEPDGEGGDYSDNNAENETIDYYPTDGEGSEGADEE